MKVLSRAQIREADQYTIQIGGIPSIELMERAAESFTQAFLRRWPRRCPVAIFAGPGNNGGDGLAIARLLQQRGHPVRVYYLHSKRYSADFQSNLQRLQSILPQYNIVPLADDHTIAHLTPRPGEVWIDSLFGTGLTRPLKGLPARLIHHINRVNVPVAAVDIPSGLFCDEPNASDDPIVRAQWTVSFQVPKLAFFMEENSEYVPEFEVRDIGISGEFIRKAKSRYSYLTFEEAAALLPQISLAAHKGMMGHLLGVGGQKGMMGAAVLMARAAIRSGVGKLTMRVPAVGYAIIQQLIPEALCLPDESVDHITTLPRLNGYSAVAVGPGIGQHLATAEVIDRLLHSKLPLVLDADALNLMARHPSLMEGLASHHILTPHPGEFRRLIGEGWESSVDKWQRLVQFARRHQTTVLLKGRYSAVASPDGHIIFNSTGNPGMAVGGTGDVLTGIIGALLARGMTPLKAAMLGAFVHGLAADLVMADASPEGLIPSDIIRQLPQTWRMLHEITDA